MIITGADQSVKNEEEKEWSAIELNQKIFFFLLFHIIPLILGLYSVYARKELIDILCAGTETQNKQPERKNSVRLINNAAKKMDPNTRKQCF